jgi:hypothetical protein
MRKGAPNKDRVSALHQKLYDSSVRAGEGGDTIHAVQQLVFLEESCQDIIAAIKAIEEGADRAEHIEQIRTSLVFVSRLVDDRELLQALTYQQRRR